MKSTRLFILAMFILVLVFSVVPSYAGCGIDHANADGQTLMDAAAALEGADPGMADQVRNVAIRNFPQKKEHGGDTKEHGGM